MLGTSWSSFSHGLCVESVGVKKRQSPYGNPMTPKTPLPRCQRENGRSQRLQLEARAPLAWCPEQTGRLNLLSQGANQGTTTWSTTWSSNQGTSPGSRKMSLSHVGAQGARAASRRSSASTEVLRKSAFLSLRWCSIGASPRGGCSRRQAQSRGGVAPRPGGASAVQLSQHPVS